MEPEFLAINLQHLFAGFMATPDYFH
jgi:hypothetical protein